MKPNRNNTLLTAALTLTLAASSAHATILFWDGAGTWTTANEWGTVAGGPYASTWTAGDDAVFNVASSTITGATTSFNSITANENVTVTSGGTLSSFGTTANITVAAGKSLTFGSQPLTGGIIKLGDGELSLSSASNNFNGGGFTLNAGTVTIGGTNVLGTSTALTINGGTLRSNGSRDMSGKFTSITIGGDFATGAVGFTGAFTFNAATALGAAVRTMTLNNNLTLNGIVSGSGGGITKEGVAILTLGAVNHDYTGATTINAGSLALNGSLIGGGAVSTSGTGILTQGASSVISGASTIAQGSSGISTLAGSNTYSGTTTATAGVLLTTKAAALPGYDALLADKVIFNGGTIAARIGAGGWTTGEVDTLLAQATKTSGALGIDTTTASITTQWAEFTTDTFGPLGLTKLGTNNLTLDADNTYTGTTTVIAGILNLSGSLSGGGAVSITGGTFSLSGSLTGGSAVATSGAGIFNQSLAGILNGASSFTQGSSGTSILSLVNTHSGATSVTAGTLSLTGSLTGGGAVTTSGTGILSQTAAGGISGASTFTQGSTGTSTLAGANSYSGATSITAGTLSLTGSFSGGSAVSTSGTGILTQGALSVISLGSSIAQGSSGTMTLAGNNSYTGTSTATAGVLLATKAAALSGYNVANKVIFNGGTIAVQIGAGGWTSPELDALLANATKTSGALGIDTATGSVNQLGSFTTANLGPLGLTKLGTNILTLNQANTYTGPTTILAGTLNVGVAETAGVSGPLGNSAAANPGSILFGGGTLQYSAANRNDYSGRFSTANNQAYNVDTNAQSVTLATNLTSSGGTLVKGGTGTLTLAGTNSYTGTTTVSAGSLSLTGSLTGGGAITITAGALNVGATGVISGASSLALNNNGANILAGANTYTGNTTLATNTTATLAVAENVDVSGPLGKQAANAAGTIVLNGGILQYTAANTFDYSGRFSTGTNQRYNADTGGQSVTWASNLTGSGTSTLTKSGLGTLTLTGANTYSGVTTVGLGTLLLDKSGSGTLATTGLTLGSANGGGNFSMKGAASGSTSQTLGTMILTANTSNTIALDPNGGTGTTLTLGNTWTRNAGSTLLVDYSSASTGTRQVVTAAATTGAVLTNGIYGAVLVKDSAGITGFATRAAGATQAITRFDDTTGTTLVDNSNTAAGNFSTLNTVYSSGTLAWSNVITNRSVNSLTIDTTNNGGTINMGAATNVLTLTSGAILFKGANSAILTGGQVGAANSEVIVHQTGAGLLTIGSKISSGTGALTKNGAGTLKLDGASTFTGLVTVSGGLLNVTGGTSSIGSMVLGAATYQQDGSSTSVTANGTAGISLGTTGTSAFILNEGTFSVTGTLGAAGNIGNGGDTTFTQTGGLFAYTPASTSANKVLNIGVAFTGSATLNLSGGTFRTGADVPAYLGGRVHTEMNISGSTTLVDIPDLRFNRNLNAAHTATLNLGNGTPGSGTLKVSSITKDSASADNVAIFNFNGGTLQAGASSATFMTGLTTAQIRNGGAVIDPNGQAITIGQSLLHSSIGGDNAIDGGLTVNDSAVTKGTLTLTGTNTYTGATTVSAGVLAVNGSLANTTTTVQNTATLQGSGTIGGSVTIQTGGTLAPGNSIESLATGALSMAAGSTFGYEVANNTPTGADLLAVGSTLSLTNVTLSLDPVSLAALAGGGWVMNDKLTLISYSDVGAGLTSGFTGYADDTSYSFGPNKWLFNYNDTLPGGNYGADAIASSQNKFVTMKLIPEPSTALLGVLGLLALLRRRRR